MIVRLPPRTSALCSWKHHPFSLDTTSGLLSGWSADSAPFHTLLRLNHSAMHEV